MMTGLGFSKGIMISTPFSSSHDCASLLSKCRFGNRNIWLLASKPVSALDR